MTQEVERVLGRVARRQTLRAWGRSAFAWTGVFAGVYAVLLLGARLVALWPDWYPVQGVVAVPLLGLLVGWFTHRRAGLPAAARAADEHLQTNDLFLTTLEADRAPGEYQELVVESATAEASKVRADEVTPLPFGRPLAQVVIALAILICAAVYLPSYDPFQSEEEKLLLGQQREQLTKETKASEKRIKKLAAKTLEDRNSAEVSQALQEVMKSFREMKRNQRKQNDKRLKIAQQNVGAKWREARAKSQNRGSQSPKIQSLGKLGDKQKIESWRKDLSAGKTDSLRRELQDLKDTLQKMAASGDQKEREKLRKEMQEKTKDLAEFLKNNASSRELNETLSKALNQLQAMATPKMMEAAQKALNQTLELSDMELKNLAQSLRDMKALEDALKALQAARQANSKGGKKGEGKDGEGKDGEGKDGQGEKGAGKGGKKGDGQGEGDQDLGLDGDGTPSLESLKEYEEYYRKLLAEQGEGQEPGPGMGGPGTGEGNVAPEDPSQKNDFKTEKSRSALVAGKLLMTLKTKEVGDRGEVKKEFAKNLDTVKQGVGEAILQERVPPGYHEGIKKYFDTLGERGEQATPPKAGSQKPGAKKAAPKQGK